MVKLEIINLTKVKYSKSRVFKYLYLNVLALLEMVLKIQYFLSILYAKSYIRYEI